MTSIAYITPSLQAPAPHTAARRRRQLPAAVPAGAATNPTGISDARAAGTAVLPYSAGAAVRVTAPGWAWPVGGAILGGLIWGMPGAFLGALGGYLLVRR